MDETAPIHCHLCPWDWWHAQLVKRTKLQKKHQTKNLPQKKPPKQQQTQTKKPLQQKQQKTILRDWLLVLLPSKELHAVEGHYGVQSGWIFLEERKKPFYTKKVTLLHSMYLSFLLQNNKDTLLRPSFSRETWYTHTILLLTISLPKN